MIIVEETIWNIRYISGVGISAVQKEVGEREFSNWNNYRPN